MNIQNIMAILLSAMLPAIWAAAGPVATTAITAWVNSVVGRYVPRPVQLVLSSVIGAILAGLTGAAEGIDPTTAIGIGAAAGLAGQTFVSIHPDTLLASPPSAKIRQSVHGGSHPAR